MSRKNTSILWTTACQRSPDTQRQISVTGDHQINFASDEESSDQASFEVLELQQQLSASERNLLGIEERYNHEYQALATKLDDSITENAKHVEDHYKQENQALAARLDDSNCENTNLQTLMQRKLNNYVLHLQNELQQVKDERD
ncbi:hypothetical protein BYT27DRAFT_7248093 [Phlegmacium glaucopus]|nr:hypothetical protein BYT27DRAFT_7248093 [Phlegmacium glaucopus]